MKQHQKSNLQQSNLEKSKTNITSNTKINIKSTNNVIDCSVDNSSNLNDIRQGFKHKQKYGIDGKFLKKNLKQHAIDISNNNQKKNFDEDALQRSKTIHLTSSHMLHDKIKFEKSKSGYKKRHLYHAGTLAPTNHSNTYRKCGLYILAFILVIFLIIFIIILIKNGIS